MIAHTDNTGATTGPLVDMFIEGAPVSANRMWRRARQGHLYISPEAVAWELAVKSQIAIVGIDRQAAQAAAQPLRVVCEFNRVRGDADNYLKPVLDGLKYGLQIDDKHFRPVESHVVADRTRPQGVRVLVYAAATTTVAPRTPPLAPPPVPAPERIRAISLIDDELRARLLAPLKRVAVYSAPDYGCVVLMFPPSPIPLRDNDEWGTFLPLSQARELRDALNALPELQTTAAGTTPTGGA